MSSEQGLHATAVRPASTAVADESADVAILIALREEWDVFWPIAGRPTGVKDRDSGRYLFRFDVVSAVGRPYRCVALCMGDMGPGQATDATHVLLQVKPRTVVNVGIAGAIHDDLKLCDVVVADQVDDYLATVKAAARGKKGYVFELRGNVYKSSYSLVQDVDNLKYAHPEAFEAWHVSCSAAMLERAEKIARARKSEQIRERPELVRVHLASGPVLAAAEEFSDWVRTRDGLLKALEMEAAGMMLAAHQRSNPISTLVLRGISDFGDRRKAKMDRKSGGTFRYLAMVNATQLLWSMLGRGMLPRHDPTRGAPAAPRQHLQPASTPTTREHVDGRLFVEPRMDPRLPRRWRRLIRGRSLPGGFSTPQEPEADRDTLQLAAVPCLVLLGEAGMGKSTELLFLHEDARSASPLLCRLGAYRSGAAILDYLEREETWRAWRSGRAPLYLFIDGLDECQLALPETVDLLVNTLAAGDRRQLVLRIACRTGAWSPRLEETLRSWYVGDDFDIVELLPLTSDDAATVAHRLLQGRVDREQLREQLGEPAIEPLAARPVTLKMLAQLLDEGQGKLPDRRVDLYQRGLHMLLREWDDDRDRRGHVDPDDPMSVARWLAAAVVLGNYTGVAARRPEPDGSVPLDALAGPVPLAHLRTVLLTNVFARLPTADASGGPRTFAQRSFAEFLAAQWLHARGLPPTELLPLLGNRERVAPQMEEVASWLAALDRSWFAHILARQPEVILRGDPAALTDTDRRDALVAVLTACAAGHLPDDTTGWEKHLWRLDFPGIEDIVAAWILAEDRSGPTLFVARRVAIDTAKTLLATPRPHADVARLLNALATVTVCEDTKTGESNVRTAAGWALKQLAGAIDTAGGLPRGLLEPAVLRLRPLLDLPRNSDPTRELRGLALLTLHPRWLTDEEFVANLNYLPGLDYFGAYESLFTHHLPAWIDGNPPRAARVARRLADLLPRTRNREPTSLLDSLLRTLTDTCAGAWPAAAPVEALVTLWLACPLNLLPPRLSPVHFADPGRRRGILRILVQIWADRRWRLLSEWLRDLVAAPFGAKFRESAQFTRLESLAHRLAASPEDPLTQVRSECRLWAPEEFTQIFASTRYDNHSFGSPETTPAGHLLAGLSNREDSLYWLQESAQEADPMVRDEYLYIAWRMIDIDDDRAIATLRAIVASTIGAARAPLEQQFASLLDDASLRELREKRKEYQSPAPQGPADGKTPEVRIAELITAGQENPSSVFPRLLSALTLRPTDTHRGDRYLQDLTNFPGWVAASPSTRQEIWSIARAFLDGKKVEDETWFGEQEFPSTLLDACRAFQLLALDPEAPPNLGLRPEIWQRWSLTLLDKLDMLSPQRLTDDLHQRLREQDPDIATRVRDIVGRAHRQGSESEVGRAIATALRVRTPAVERVLVERARAADLPTWADRNLLTGLVKDGHPEVHAVALARLADQLQIGRAHRCNAILALMQRGLRPVEWPEVWRALRSESDLLLDVFAAQGMSFTDRSQAFRDVAASDIGELLDHLLTTFPMDADDDRPSRRGVMPVTPRMQAGHARDDLLRFLARRAHPEDADELQRIVDDHDLQSIRWLVHEARATHGRRAWRPRSPAELMALTARGTCNET